MNKYKKRYSFNSYPPCKICQNTDRPLDQNRVCTLCLAKIKEKEERAKYGDRCKCCDENVVPKRGTFAELDKYCPRCQKMLRHSRKYSSSEYLQSLKVGSK